MRTSKRDPRPIVVGIDELDSARAAAQWAADLAAIWGAPLHLMHAVSGRNDEPLSAGVPAWLRELADAAVRSGAEDTCTEIFAGATADLLLDRSTKARMLVVGSYGDGVFSGMLAGMTALTLIERAGCPVAVVRGSAPQIAPPRGGPVMVGVDGTQSGDAALDLAAELAESLGARLLAVHAWSDIVPDGSGAAHRLGDSWTVLAGRGAALLEDRLARVQARHPELRIERQVVEGTPLRAILDRAPAAHVVVVGHRAHVRPGAMLLGSTSRGLVEFAPCPVVVSRPPADRLLTADGRSTQAVR